MYDTIVKVGIKGYKKSEPMIKVQSTKEEVKEH